MTKPVDRPEMLRILWATRIDAVANRWHITRRTLPHLQTMADQADDDQLRAAIAHTTTAITHLDAMLDGLRAAIDLIQPPPPGLTR